MTAEPWGMGDGPIIDCSCPAVWHGVIPPTCPLHNPASGRLTTTTSATLVKDPNVTLKLDQGKPRVDLLPVRVLFSVAKVLGFGAEKYLPDNWRNGANWRRYYASALRHVFAWAEGEDLDPESGLNHLDHAICDLMFLREFQHAGTGTDDRYKPAERDHS